MTINELKTGNIIIDRSGYAGIVIVELDRIIYQEHEQICAIYDIEYNVANANLFNDIFEAMVNE